MARQIADDEYHLLQLLDQEKGKRRWKMMKHSLSVLIPDGETVLATIRCLGQVPGVKVHVLSSKRWAVARFSRHLAAYEFNPAVTDPKERLKATLDLVKRHRIDVILPVSVPGVEFAATYHQALSAVAAVAPVPDLHAFTTADNKWLLNQLACQNNVPAPPAILATLDSTFYRQLSGLEYPVLIKPTNGRGGIGISRFESQADLLAYLDRQDEAQFKNKYFVQQYVPGVNVGINVLCRNGELLAYTIQKCLRSQPFSPPMAIQFFEHNGVLDIGQRLLSALNWSGVANIDLQYDSDTEQAHLLEVNPRFWLTLAGSLVVGVNFPYLACLTALDIPFPTPHYRLGKFVQTQPAAEEFLRRLAGKGNLDGFTFRETGWVFFLRDPLPELMNAAAEFGRNDPVRRFVPDRLLGFFNEVAA